MGVNAEYRHVVKFSQGGNRHPAPIARHSPAMGWLQVDLRGLRVPVPHDSGSARARRLALRKRLLRDSCLSGAAALAIVAEIQQLELREAADSLQELVYHGNLCNITGCDSRLRAA